VSQTLIDALQNPKLYDHPVEAFQILETHISWILLTGPFAYKIKKPLNFGFLDFSSLDKRAYYCHQEIILNKRLAEDLYLEVIPICGSKTHPSFGREDEAFEYAVKMVQFPQNQLADQLLLAGELSLLDVEELAQTVASFHQHLAEQNGNPDFGKPAQVMAPVLQNFEQIEALIEQSKDLKRLEHIATWAKDHLQFLKSDLTNRKAGGFVRNCHGDLHLGNITRFRDRYRLFDCIEFNEQFRWIDVMSEVAFLVMDFENLGYPSHANHFLNAYLEITGDYSGLKVFEFYKSYRAMVRAKVTLLKLNQEGLSRPAREEIFQVFSNYIELAERYTQQQAPQILLMHGYSGTGKSTVSVKLVDELGCIRLRSDVERKRLLCSYNQTEKGVFDLYSQEASDLTFKQLSVLAQSVLQAGYSVLIDATFLSKTYRDLFHQLADSMAVPLQIISCVLDEKITIKRIRMRAAIAMDPSDADEKVYQQQLLTADALTDRERAHCIEVETRNAMELDTLVDYFQGESSWPHLN